MTRALAGRLARAERRAGLGGDDGMCNCSALPNGKGAGVGLHWDDGDGAPGADRPCPKCGRTNRVAIVFGWSAEPISGRIDVDLNLAKRREFSIGSLNWAAAVGHTDEERADKVRQLLGIGEDGGDD